MTEIVRVLIPDHPDLYGQLGRAIEFAGALRHANEPDDPGGSDHWQLPATLIAAELEEALDKAVFHDDWFREVGDDTDTNAINVTNNDVEHMGVYPTTATTAQLHRLAAAYNLLVDAEHTAPSQRTPEMQEIADFVSAYREADESGGYDASLAAWQVVVRLLALSLVPTPTSAYRPSRLYNIEGFMLPSARIDGTSPAADTALLVDRIDASNGRSVNLDPVAFQAWRRLSVEWHIAIYGEKANDPNSILQSYAY